MLFWGDETRTQAPILGDGVIHSDSTIHSANFPLTILFKEWFLRVGEFNFFLQVFKEGGLHTDGFRLISLARNEIWGWDFICW